MVQRMQFDLETEDLLPHFLASLTKLDLKTPVKSWEKMVSCDNQGHRFEVEGEYRSSERPNFR